MMFTDKKQLNNKPKRKGSSFHESAVTILTPGCHFNGKLYCRGSSRIGGKIEGEIISEGILIVEEEAQISARIKADEVVIQGQVCGELEATCRVKIAENGSFEGNLCTPSLIINEGGRFNGSSSMKSSEEIDKKSTPLLDTPIFAGKKGAKEKGESKLPEVSVN